MKKCIRKVRKWNYRCVIDDPIWMDGKRWDCSTFVMYFYNQFVLPRADKLNKSAQAQVTDEKGKALKPWAYYPYQAKKGSVLVNNTVTLLSRVGKPWKEKRVKAYKAYKQKAALPS